MIKDFLFVQKRVNSEGYSQLYHATQKDSPKNKMYTYQLNFKNRASHIQDGRSATPQMFYFIYFFQQI